MEGVDIVGYVEKIGIAGLCWWFASQLLKRLDKVSDGISAALAGAVADMQHVKGELATLADRVAERVWARSGK